MKNIDVSFEEYDQLVELQIKNGVPFSEHNKGSRKTLYVFGSPVASIVSGYNSLDIGNLPYPKFYSFLASFKRGLYQNLFSNEKLITFKIDFDGSSRGKNRDLFQTIEIEQSYYNLDLISAYWQIGYRLGYVSKKNYLKYLKNDDYKAAKRLCFSFLARCNYKEYLNPDGSKYIIECDNSIDQQVYDNVRNELYRIILGAVDLINSSYIDYNIDGISFLKSELPIVKKYFDDLELEYKINPCVKQGDSHYLYKGKIRKY
jgi:hypothetical protein